MAPKRFQRQAVTGCEYWSALACVSSVASNDDVGIAQHALTRLGAPSRPHGFLRASKNLRHEKRHGRQQLRQPPRAGDAGVSARRGAWVRERRSEGRRGSWPSTGGLDAASRTWRVTPDDRPALAPPRRAAIGRPRSAPCRSKVVKPTYLTHAAVDISHACGARCPVVGRRLTRRVRVAFDDTWSHTSRRVRGLQIGEYNVQTSAAERRFPRAAAGHDFCWWRALPYGCLGAIAWNCHTTLC